MRIIVIALLLIAAHFSLTVFAPAPAGQAKVFWPFAADAKPILAGIGGLPQQSGSTLTPLLAGIAGLGFLAAAFALFGWWVPVGWWASLTVTSAVASILLFTLYVGPWAVLPIMIDVVLLWGVVIQHWSVTEFRGV